MIPIAELAIEAHRKARHEPLDPGARTSATPWKLEHQQASWAKHSQEFAQIAPRVGRLNMLQRDVRVDEVERRVSKEPQVNGAVLVIVAALRTTVELIGELDHRRRDVDTVNLVEVARQSLRQTARTTAEVERTFMTVEAKAIRMGHYEGDFLNARLKELVRQPAIPPLAPPTEDRPEGIGPTGPIPTLREVL